MAVAGNNCDTARNGLWRVEQLHCFCQPRNARSLSSRLNRRHVEGAKWQRSIFLCAQPTDNQHDALLSRLFKVRCLLEAQSLHRRGLTHRAAEVTIRRPTWLCHDDDLGVTRCASGWYPAMNESIGSANRGTVFERSRRMMS